MTIAIVQSRALQGLEAAAVTVEVHLANGLYANAAFDRLLGGWSTRRAS